MFSRNFYFVFYLSDKYILDNLTNSSDQMSTSLDIFIRDIVMFLFIQYIMFVVKRSNYWNLELDNIYFLDSHSYTKCWQKRWKLQQGRINWNNEESLSLYENVSTKYRSRQGSEWGEGVSWELGIWLLWTGWTKKV